MNMELCDFAKRHLDPNFSGTQITEENLFKIIDLAQESELISEGYADFCKIIALPNSDDSGKSLFPDLKLLTLDRQWALDQGAIIKTAYEARNADELPVLQEWIEGLQAPIAPWIHLILYSREQLALENDIVEADWGIVSIQTSPTSEIEPMRPITAMRNALGVEEGGSGVALSREDYCRSVDYWSKHIALR